jgi:signal transduction histidine kinase
MAADGDDAEGAASGRQAPLSNNGSGQSFPSTVATGGSTGTIGGTGRRWRLANWRLRRKLIVVLLVPSLATILFAGLVVRTEVTQINSLGSVLDEARLGAQASSVIDAVQQERDAALVFAGTGRASGGDVYTQKIAATDAQVKAYTAAISSDGKVGPAAQAAAETSTNSLGGLGVLRSSLQSTAYPPSASLLVYDTIIANLLQVSSAVANDAGSTGQSSQAVNQFSHLKEDLAQQNSVMLLTTSPGQSSQALTDQLRGAQSAQQSDLAAYNSAASLDQQQQFGDTVSGPPVDAQASYVEQVLAQGAAGNTANGAVALSQQDVMNNGAATVKLYRQLEQNLQDQFQTNLTDLRTSTEHEVLINLLIALIILLVALAIMLSVSASLISPLRSLRTNALDVARNRLPAAVKRILASDDPIEASRDVLDPVPPFTREEIGEVARSFDVVQDQAVRLAAEQAVLRDNVNAIFVNLSRRSQALVERQLALIDRLEKDEQDPDQLSNLFELDHLATRMRRNSESLLVLSGSGLAKRMSRPVPIGELVGAAVSEVEQYARIDVGAPPNASVLGRVVNDLIHLIAELLDNATTYSEPNTKVNVRIARTRARELAIQVTDRGVGMSEDDIRSANERLADPPAIDVGVTRRMGLYVVARLAKRHGIRVKLRANEDIDGGTVALIVIPEELVHRPGEEPLGTGLSGALSGGLGNSMGGGSGIAGAFDAPELPAAPERGRKPETQGAAAAAAGIAGAFGLASSRNTGRDEARPPAPADDEEIFFDEEQPAAAEPATAYWGAGDFGRSEPEPERQQAPPQAPSRPQQAEPEAFWEAHTEAGALPAVPAEPPEPMPAEAAADKPVVHHDFDAPTERLPIYEAVLSQWFRPDENAPNGAANGSNGSNGSANGAAHPAPPAPAAPVAPAEPVRPADPEPQADPDSGGLPTRVPGRAAAAAGFQMERRGDTGSTPRPAGLSGTAPRNGGSGGTSSTSSTGSTGGIAAALGGGSNGHAATPPPAAQAGPAPFSPGVPLTAENAWQTPADEGWQAAEALLAPVSETTSVGLPKRVPKAHLVPGSASNQAPAKEDAATPPRSAEAIRGRMSSFQQGVRRGRHALTEAYSGESTNQHRHEEQE